MTAQPPSIPLLRAWKTTVTRALVFAVALARTALIDVRAGFESSRDPRARLTAEVDRLKSALARAEEEKRILRARIEALAPRRRPHYPPAERLAILTLRAAAGWTAADTARRFVITPATIANWTRRLDEHGPAALVRPRARQPLVRLRRCAHGPLITE